MITRYSWKNLNDGLIDINTKLIDNVTGKAYKIYVGLLNISMPVELRTRDVLIWAICTTKNFVLYVSPSFYSPEIIDEIVENFEYPGIFMDHHFNEHWILNLTSDQWQKAYQRNKEVARFIPSEYQTKDTIETLCNLKKVDLNSDLYKIMTPEIFGKIYFNLEESDKLRLFPSAQYRPKEAKRVSEFVTQTIADDILSIDITRIWLVPSNYISKDNAEKAMNEDIRLLEFVPAKYQTLERQYELINKNPALISLIDPTVLLDEVMYYALSKRGTILSKIPVERRTYDICTTAINYYPASLKHVPDEVKTAEMCFNAVARKPDMIKYVPVKFLTEEFVEALNRANVIIPMNFSGYVNECLSANNRLKGEDIKETEPINFNVDINADYMNLRLNTFPTLFSNTTIEFFQENGVFTFGDLLNKNQDKEFNSEVLKASVLYYKEMTIGLKILKCKYLNIDPLVDLSYDNETTMDDISERFGFDSRITNALRRKGYTPQTFFELLKEEDAEHKLKMIRNMGATSVEQILYKTSVIMNYYENKEEQEQIMTEDETIEELTKELEETRTEIQRLNSRIDEILLKIQEKTLGKKKGGL